MSKITDKRLPNIQELAAFSGAIDQASTECQLSPTSGLSSQFSSESMHFWERATNLADNYLQAMELSPMEHFQILNKALDQAAATIDWRLPDNATAIVFNCLQQELGEESKRISLWNKDNSDFSPINVGRSYPEFRRISMTPGAYRPDSTKGILSPVKKLTPGIS